ELEALWVQLAGVDTRKAHLAIRTLAGDPRQAVPFLKVHLQPVTEPDAERIARLIADMDSNQFATRAQATKELEQLGELAAPAMDLALKKEGLSLESRRRLEGLLGKRSLLVTDPDQLRALRALEVLEIIGTPEAREVLGSVSKGAPQARRTREAQACLQRL